MYVYKLKGSATVSSYDEAMAVACIQGVLNRDGIELYVESNSLNRPSYWLEKLGEKGWLAKERVPVSSLEQLFELSKNKLQGVIIWDPEVPASLNVATTLAGLEDGLVLSPEMAKTYGDQLN